MFKLFSLPKQTGCAGIKIRHGELLAVALLFFLVAGCATAPPFPKVNFAESAWKLHEGQAIWRANRSAPEIAGEILMADDTTGRTFVQFTKTPFPLVIAQTTTNAWQIEAPTKNRRYSGYGQPPAGVLWFQLPRAYAGVPLSPKWSWRKTETSWRLEKRSTGEFLEGYFTP